MPGTKFVYIDRKRIKLPPLMFVKCSDSLKRKVEEGLPLLEGKKHAKYKFRLGIKRHEPDAIVAAKIRYQEQIGNLIARNQKKNSEEEQDTFFFRGASLFVNGKKVVDPLIPPSPKLLLSLSQEEVKDLEGLPVVTGVENESDRGSRYFSYAARANKLDDVKQLYNRIKLQHLSATHVSVGFRFGITSPDSSTPTLVRTGGSPDGEHQADIRICHAINKSTALDVVVFVVRYYGGAPLGSARLKNVFNYATVALDNLGANARALGSPLRTLPRETDDDETHSKSPEAGSQEVLFPDTDTNASVREIDSLPPIVESRTDEMGEEEEGAGTESHPDESRYRSDDGSDNEASYVGQNLSQESDLLITNGQDTPSGVSKKAQDSNRSSAPESVQGNGASVEEEEEEDEEVDGGGKDEEEEDEEDGDQASSKSGKGASRRKKRKPRKLTVTPKKIRRDKRLNKQLFNEFEHY